MNIVELPKIIIRHAPPGKLDHAPLGTKCHVVRRFQDNADIYLQTSSCEDDPQWEYCGMEPNQATL